MSIYSKTGIYCIENSVNHKKYIGCTMNCFRDRIDNHFYKLRNGKHQSKAFQEDYNKYGESVFEFYILEEIDKDIHDKDYFFQKEEYFINKYDTTNTGYNLSVGGTCGMNGLRLPDEVYKKVGEINRQRLTGTHLSDEIKEKISKSNKGKKMSEEAKQKISKGNTGKIRTVEMRKRQSELSNRKLTDEQAIIIKELIRQNIMPSKISEITGVSVSIINDIKRGRTYKLV